MLANRLGGFVGRGMGFTICYSFQGKRTVIEHPAEILSPHDAVCYALLHTGVFLQERPSSWVGSYASVVELAERLGVTNVSWHQSIIHLSVPKLPVHLAPVANLDHQNAKRAVLDDTDTPVITHPIFPKIP